VTEQLRFNAHSMPASDKVAKRKSLLVTPTTHTG